MTTPLTDAFPAIDLCRAAYSRNLLGEQARTTYDGYIRTRRRTRSRGVTDTTCWVSTAEQCQALEDFHRQQGGDYFILALPDWQGLTDTVVRFDSPLTVMPVKNHYEITASLYIPQPSLIPDDELDGWLLKLIGVTDARFGLPIYYWVNINWGVLWNTGIRDSTFGEPINAFVHHQWPDYWRNP